MDYKHLQLTPDTLNLQGKSKKVRVIGSSKKIAGSKKKTVFAVQWKFKSQLIVEMSSEN